MEGYDVASGSQVAAGIGRRLPNTIEPMKDRSVRSAIGLALARVASLEDRIAVLALRLDEAGVLRSAPPKGEDQTAAPTPACPLANEITRHIADRTQAVVDTIHDLTERLEL